jgi:hypothetical protein
LADVHTKSCGSWALAQTDRLASTHPTGVFRGESGWLVVTAASDRLITGQFHADASSSFRGCQDAE